MRCSLTRLFASLCLAVGVALTCAVAPAQAGSSNEHANPFYCLTDNPPVGADRTVLLVHGVGLGSRGSFSWNLENSLASVGYDVCFVDLPRNGRANLVDSGEHVASAIKSAHERLGKPVSVIGHSAGPAAILWAVQYDDSAAEVVDDVVSIAGALNGVWAADLLCNVLGGCPAIGWQMRPGSEFLASVHAKKLPENISFTSVYSRIDYGLQPADQVSSIAGASNIAVQDVCPQQLPGHIGILASPAMHAVVRDALTHDGAANSDRISREVCGQILAPGVNVFQTLSLLPGVVEYAKLLIEPRVSQEPPLPDYATQEYSATSIPLGGWEQTTSSGVAGSAESFAKAIGDALRIG